MGKAVAIGATVGAAGATGFLGGIAAVEGIATVICPPAGLILGGAIAIGTGIGAVSKVIFG